MEKAEFDAIFQNIHPGFDCGPIEDHLRAIGQDEDPPAVALGTCLARIEEAGPPLIALMERDPCPCGSGKKYKKCCLKG